jgi:vacuolar protein sorting-associated protein 54
LDITETNISKQISTKANSFFYAMNSQDEVQEHVSRTCTAVKSLRSNIKFIDEKVVLTAIRIIKLVSLQIKYKQLVEKLELMSTVYQTQPTIQLHLASSEFTGALDLISMSQDILRQDLRGVRALRHYDSQFSEIEKAIDKILHQEFNKFVINELSRDFTHGTTLSNTEKLSSLVLGILRLKTSNFIDLLKEEIFIYLKSTIKQTCVEYVSKTDDESFVSNSSNKESSSGDGRLMDRVRQIKIQEFLHLLAKILSNTKTMLCRIKEMLGFIISILNSAAGVKPDESQSIFDENNQINQEIM